MAGYDISLKARDDLSRIWEYTLDNWSEEQADRYYGFLTAGMDSIAAAPMKVDVSYDEIFPGLRALHVNRHMIFFIVQPGGRVMIVRILHDMMDYIRHLDFPIDVL